ncbi:hypothetical protein BDQ17DRAFT_1424401 [Cyathus striatus]|nr:hypothetical protein BDQ17DRAFT_1424401 [Cyathus striatus]
MGQFFDEIPPSISQWIQQQKMFWVATAPLAEDGHVNISPKAPWHIPCRRLPDVWYEDLTGSGSCASLARGCYEFGTPEYEELLPVSKRQAGSRAVIMVDVHKVGSVSPLLPPFSSLLHRTNAIPVLRVLIPFYDFRSDRMKLHIMAANKELQDISAESCLTAPAEPPRPRTGLKGYWFKHNMRSIDGLPALESAYESIIKFERDVWEAKREKDDETPRGTTVKKERQGGNGEMVIWGFMLGVAASAAVGLLRRRV